MAGSRGMWDTRDSAHGTEPEWAGIPNRGGQGEHAQSRGDVMMLIMLFRGTQGEV